MSTKRTTEPKPTTDPEKLQAEYTWLRTSEVAAMLGVDAQTVRGLIKDGHLDPPGVMDVSRSSRPRFMVSRARLDRFIADSEKRVAS